MENTVVWHVDDREEGVSTLTDHEQEQSIVRILRNYFRENDTTQLPLCVFENYVQAKPEYQKQNQDE